MLSDQYVSRNPIDTMPASSFPEAIERFKAQCHYEIAVVGDPQGFWADQIRQAERALDIWQMHVLPAQQRAAHQAAQDMEAVGLSSAFVEAATSDEFDTLRF
jgi:hypothetical protein